MTEDENGAGEAVVTFAPKPTYVLHLPGAPDEVPITVDPIPDPGIT